MECPAAEEVLGRRAEGPWTAFRARLAHRVAMHVSVAPFVMANDRPLMSVTFDDAPDTALTTGAAMLEEAGARGTFYVSGGLLGARTPQWRVIDRDGVAALHGAGHEIGCHTYSHARANHLGRGAFRDEIRRNRDCLAAIDPTLEVRNFAFPYGVGSLFSKRHLRDTYVSSRSIVPGLNRGTVDLHFLQAMPLIDRWTDESGIDRALDECLATNGWLIFYTHDVKRDPSRFGCSPGLLAHAIRAARRRGVALASVAQALERIGRTKRAPDP